MNYRGSLLLEAERCDILFSVSSRYPYEQGDVRARVSRNEGQTWAPEVYHLSPGHGYGGSVVLGDDTIVTACGNAQLDRKGRSASGQWTAQIVRWRLPTQK